MELESVCQSQRQESGSLNNDSKISEYGGCESINTNASYDKNVLLASMIEREEKKKRKENLFLHYNRKNYNRCYNTLISML